MESEQAYYALAAYARVTSGNAHGLYDMDDAKKLDDAALEDVLREIEALGEITDASRETYVKLETIRQKIRYLKDEDKKTAQDALEEKQSAFDEILAEKKQTARTVSLSKVYDAVIDAAKKEDPSLLTDAALEEVRKVMAQAEKAFGAVNLRTSTTAICITLEVPLLMPTAVWTQMEASFTLFSHRQLKKAILII